MSKFAFFSSELYTARPCKGNYAIRCNVLVLYELVYWLMHGILMWCMGKLVSGIKILTISFVLIY